MKSGGWRSCRNPWIEGIKQQGVFERTRKTEALGVGISGSQRRTKPQNHRGGGKDMESEEKAGS